MQQFVVEALNTMTSVTQRVGKENPKSFLPSPIHYKIETEWDVVSRRASPTSNVIYWEIFRGVRCEKDETSTPAILALMVDATAQIPNRARSMQSIHTNRITGVGKQAHLSQIRVSASGKDSACEEGILILLHESLLQLRGYFKGLWTFGRVR